MSTLNLQEAEKRSIKAKQKFLRNAEFLVCLKDPDKALPVVMASAELDPESVADVTAALDPEVFDQPHPGAREIARKSFEDEVYRAICKATVRCFNRGALRLAIKFTDPGHDEYLEIRYIAGELERPAAKPVVPVKSAPEQLEDEVIADYNGAIPTDAMKKKMNNNVAYRNTYKRLAETDKLASLCTQLHDGAKL